MMGRRHQRHAGAGEQARAQHGRAAVGDAAQPRQQHAGGDPAHAHQPEQQAEAAGAEPELLAHHQRQHRPGGGRRQEVGDRAHHRRAHRRGVADELHAGAHRRQQVLARQGAAAAPVAPPGDEHGDADDERQRIEQEGQRRAAEQHQHAAQRRADRAGQVEADAVQRDGRHQVGARHHLRHGGAPGRLIHGAADADAERQQHQPAGVDAAGIGQRGQQRPRRAIVQTGSRSGKGGGRRCRPARRPAMPAGRSARSSPPAPG